MPKAKCRNNPEHDRFYTTVHEVHLWEVDQNGDYVEDVETLEVTHGPSSGNTWTCLGCEADNRKAAGTWTDVDNVEVT